MAQLWSALVILAMTGCAALDNSMRSSAVGVLEPDITCTYDSFDCNPAVRDVVGQITRLRQRGVALGFHPGIMAGTPSRWHHWQSIQRMTGAHSNYLVLTRANLFGHDPVVQVVQLASRATTGRRLTSNRAGKGRIPPSSDRVVQNVYASTGHPHAGGTQLAGKILAVPLEGARLGSQIELFDVSNPASPTSIGLVAHAVPGGHSREAGTVALAKLASGRFVLVIGRRRARTLDFYQSTTRNIRDTGWTFLDSWSARELRTEIGDRHFGGYQNLQLVAGRDRELYLVGMHREGLVMGPQWVDVYRVGGSSSITLTKLAKRRVDCKYQGTQCNLDAGGGVYIDPEGTLIVYGVEHANEGPATAGGAPSIKLTEF